MKKTITATIATIGQLFGFPISRAFAEVDINIRETAVDNDLPGTENSAMVDAGLGFWIGRILNIVLVFAALAVLINLVLAGIEWVTAGGDSGKIQKARDKILQSVIGLIVLASTIALFILLQDFLNIDILQFTFPPTP